MKQKIYICNECALEWLEPYCPECDSTNCEEKKE